jgi:hypothetical protein
MTWLLPIIGFFKTGYGKIVAVIAMVMGAPAFTWFAGGRSAKNKIARKQQKELDKVVKDDKELEKDLRDDSYSDLVDRL